MRQMLAIMKFTLKENISNRIFNGLIFFGILIIFTLSILKELALYEKMSAVENMGILLIEFFVLIITIYISSTQYLKDKQEKSIYLVLTKPVSRGSYIWGKYLGIVLTVLFNIFFMGIILYLLMFVQGSKLGLSYVVSLLFIFYKFSILASIGILFSVIGDSIMIVNLFTFSTYIIAHAVLELKLMADRVGNIFYKVVLNFLYYVLPNFRVLNYKDYLQIINIDLIRISLYVLGYIFIVMCITIIIFGRKEFT